MFNDWHYVFCDYLKRQHFNKGTQQCSLNIFYKTKRVWKNDERHIYLGLLSFHVYLSRILRGEEVLYVIVNNKINVDRSMEISVLRSIEPKKYWLKMSVCMYVVV